MRKTVTNLIKSYFYNHELQIALGTAIMFLSWWTIFYHLSEWRSRVDSLYFSVTTLATVWYWDLSPTHDSSKLFTILFIIFGVGIILTLVDYIAKHHLNMVNKWVKKRKMQEILKK
jgi:hypothetical protein